MNATHKERIRRWVKALRSGKYKQTRGALRTDRAYCCLGVACDLFAKETNRGYWTEYDKFVGNNNVGQYGILIEPVARYFGVSPSGSLPYNDCTLVDLNDGNPTSGIEKQSFATIAQALVDNFLRKKPRATKLK